jgi:hopanoid-associated phosphorylase
LPAAPILVVTGLARESRLVAGPGTVVVASGGNAARLGRLLAALPPRECRAVLSFGIAGGLEAGAAAGSVIVASRIVSGSRIWAADEALAGRLRQRLAAGGLPALRAEIAGSDIPVLDARSKAALYDISRAAAVDMESHVAAEYAEAQGLPFAALRVVCDPSSRDLPPLAATAIGPDGDIRLANVLARLLREPGQVKALPQLARESRAAFQVLRRCRDLLGIGRGRADMLELFGDVA